MSYPQISDPNFLGDLLSRKEFYSLKADSERNFRDPAEASDDVILAKHLKINSHQLFVGNFMNPDTIYRRLHLYHSTGTGKTLGAIYVAHKFMRVYRKLYAVSAAKVQATRRNIQDLDRDMPTIFVLGFGGTKSAFIRDLMKYPDFGFISLAEKEELGKRQQSALSGLSDDVRHYKEFFAMIKKRITSKAKGGFFKFFGYDEFVNRLFHSDTVSLTDLETIVLSELKAGKDATLESVFKDHIDRGIIQVNTTLMNMFTNSLLICDEIHNTYNMNMKNNRGVAIQYILDLVPSLRFLSLSATPINNSPTEVVEWINYLVMPDQKVTKREMFANPRTLHPGKLEQIGILLKGRVSFLQDVNPKYFPAREFVGKEIVIPHAVANLSSGANIPYLKFIECPMSKFHQATYVEYQKNPVSTVMVDSARMVNATPTVDSDDTSSIIALATGKTIGDDEGDLADELNSEFAADVSDVLAESSYHSIPTDGYSIYDIAFPNPESTEHGLFRSSDVKNKLIGSTQKWRDENNVTVKKFSTLNYVIGGNFLHRSNIGKYSAKYERVLEIIDDIFASYGGRNGTPRNNDVGKCQKVMIYHDRVKMSGVLLIQELLRANGFLDEFTEPVDGSLCCVCGYPLSEHNTGKSDVSNVNTTPTPTHEYRPARFVVAHSDIDKATMDQSLAKFNATDNLHGTNYMILIGSKIVKESYDFKDIQNLIVTSLPVNIPTFLQVIGRCVRKASHIALPLDQRRVRVYILISMMNLQLPHTDDISPEMYRYIDKLSDYIIIQQIEREILRNTIDADIHRDIIMQGVSKEPTLGHLYFEPANVIGQVAADAMPLATFVANRYYEEEIRTICFIIKRLFLRNSVWTYDQLWKTVQAPPIGLEVNPALFSEDNFIIALASLVTRNANIISAKTGPANAVIILDKLFDYNEKFIYVNGQKSQIEHVDKYYILFPVMSPGFNLLNASAVEKESFRDRERALIRGAPRTRDHPIIDVEMYIRHKAPEKGVMMSIDGFIADSQASITYSAKRGEFIKEMFSVPEDDFMVKFLSNYTDRFQISFLEEAIIHGINGIMVEPTALPQEPKVETNVSKIDENESTSILDALVDEAALSGSADNTSNTSNDERVQSLYKRVLQLANQFRVLITVAEVRKYKDTAKQYKNGLPNVPPATPIGYMSSKVVRLYDLSDGTGQWLEVNKIALNRQIQYKENEIIVGYFETVEDSMKFKLRTPIQKITMHKGKSRGIAAVDTRLIERGIVCTTKNKGELLHIISQLGISTSKLEPSDIRIKKLCEVIKHRLITSELKERQKDSRYKYLYSWWDELPDLGKAAE